MNKKISLGVAAAIALIAVAVTFTATMIFSMRLFDQKVLSVKERASMYDKLSEIDTVVRQNYYYKIDDEFLFDSISDGYITGMEDPETSYLTASEVAARLDEIKGTVISVGVETQQDAGGYMTVTEVRGDSSAFVAGIQTGDVITALNGESVLSIGYDEAVKLLTGVEGTKLTVTYTRDAAAETTVDLQRQSLEIQSVSGFMDEDEIYYIRIGAFNDYTVSQFEYEINIALSNNANGLIIDLRNTFGGYDVAITASMLDRLLPAGKTISAVYMNDQTKVLYTSDDSSVALPIVVMINANTTGLAEMFAAVVRDGALVGRIVGENSAGKGMLQQLIQLSDGSGINLTVAELIAPKSGSFNENGVEPDFEATADAEFTLSEQPDQLTDAQYKKAVDIMKSVMS